MVELQDNLEAFKKAGIAVVAISYDPVSVLSRFAKQQKIGYPLLSDEGSKTIDGFGIRNRDERVANSPRLNGIPHPGTFVIGEDGTVLAKQFHEGYRERHTSEQIIKAATAK